MVNIFFRSVIGRISRGSSYWQDDIYVYSFRRSASAHGSVGRTQSQMFTFASNPMWLYTYIHTCMHAYIQLFSQVTRHWTSWSPKGMLWWTSFIRRIHSLFLAFGIEGDRIRGEIGTQACLLPEIRRPSLLNDAIYHLHLEIKNHISTSIRTLVWLRVTEGKCESTGIVRVGFGHSRLHSTEVTLINNR